MYICNTSFSLKSILKVNQIFRCALTKQSSDIASLKRMLCSLYIFHFQSNNKASFQPSSLKLYSGITLKKTQMHKMALNDKLQLRLYTSI